MSRKKDSARRAPIPLHASVSEIMREVFTEINERNFSISAIARKAGVTRELVYRWAKGHSPRLFEIEAVLAVLGRALYTKDSDNARYLVDADLRPQRGIRPVGRTPALTEMPDEEFLSYMLVCAQDGTFVSAAQVNRMKALAKYAETPHPRSGWWGAIDETEAAKAVGRARAYLAKGATKCS